MTETNQEEAGYRSILEWAAEHIRQTSGAHADEVAREFCKMFEQLGRQDLSDELYERYKKIWGG